MIDISYELLLSSWVELGLTIGLEPIGLVETVLLIVGVGLIIGVGIIVGLEVVVGLDTGVGLGRGLHLDLVGGLRGRSLILFLSFAVHDAAPDKGEENDAADETSEGDTRNGWSGERGVVVVTAIIGKGAVPPVVTALKKARVGFAMLRHPLK